MLPLSCKTGRNVGQPGLHWKGKKGKKSSGIFKNSQKVKFLDPFFSPKHDVIFWGKKNEVKHFTTGLSVVLKSIFPFRSKPD